MLHIYITKKSPLLLAPHFSARTVKKNSMHFFNEEGKKYSRCQEDLKSGGPFASYSQLSIEMVQLSILFFILIIFPVKHS